MICSFSGSRFPGERHHGSAVGPQQKAGSDQPADPPQRSNLVRISSLLFLTLVFPVVVLHFSTSFLFSSSVLSATLRVWLGSWGWRSSRSPCGPTCPRTPWGPPWWRSASLQARGRWPQEESLLLTRRKSGKNHCVKTET